ncbi:YvbH-like oligomerization domain-containing protein [Bacillus taeanensis]|nr:YvbH-like oligomerization domain-containing protein [Bacillus taeanensis]
MRHSKALASKTLNHSSSTKGHLYEEFKQLNQISFSWLVNTKKAAWCKRF